MAQQGTKKFCLVADIPPDSALDLMIPNTLVAEAYDLVVEEIMGYDTFLVFGTA